MILCELYIKAFAGLEEKRIRFGDGITVIHGPNEAGKSTIFHAILHTLLTPVQLAPARFKKELERFVPFGTKKALQTSLKIRVGGRNYRIDKQWPDQLQLWDEDENRCIGTEQSDIDSLLPAQRSIVRNVALQTQKETTTILEHLGKNQSVAQHLSDFFRAQVFTPAPGFSFERFQNLLTLRIKEQCSHWEDEADAPEKGRDYRNPWKKERGKILQAYYHWQGLSDSLRDFSRLEEEMSALRQHVRDLNKELDIRKKEAKTLQERLTDLLKREKAHSDHEKRAGELNRLQKLRLSWPRLSEHIKDIRKRIPASEKGLEDLVTEHDNATKKEQIPSLRIRLSGKLQTQQALKELEKEYHQLNVLSDTDLSRVQEMAQQCQQIQMKMDKGSIHTYLTAKMPIEVQLAHAQSDSEKLRLSTKETVQKRDLSFLVIETDQLSLRIEEDSVNVPQLIREKEEKRKKYRLPLR